MHEIIVSSSEVIEKTITDADADVVIHAKEDSHATVSVVFDPKSACAVSLHIIVDANARLTVLCMSTYAKASVDRQVAKSKKIAIKQTSKISDGGHLQLQNITLGSDVEQSIESNLKGANAKSDIDWIFYAHKKDHHALSARNVFEGREGGGEITMKGVAEGKAHVRCAGLIDIGAGGTGTDTYLTEDVLMLDETAKVDAVPSLEIKTNDVQASHSATVSKVTPEDLFYFASRGINQSNARQMYVQGFLGDLTKKIENSKIQKYVVDALEEKYVMRDA